MGFQDCCPNDLQLQTLTVDFNGAPNPRCVEGSVNVYFRSVAKRLVAVLGLRFQQYITRDLDAVHNCYIAEYDSSERKVDLFGENSLLLSSYVSDVQLHQSVESITTKQN